MTEVLLEWLIYFAYQPDQIIISEEPDVIAAMPNYQYALYDHPIFQEFSKAVAITM